MRKAVNGALEAMVRPLAVELAPVRVNAVSPGVIDTPWWDVLPPEQRSAFMACAAAMAPAKRVGRPQDVADAVQYLAGAGFVTGTVLEVAGGANLTVGAGGNPGAARSPLFRPGRGGAPARGSGPTGASAARRAGRRARASGNRAGG